MKFFLNKGLRRKQIDNKRKFTRRASFIITDYVVQEGTFRDVIKNLSAGGLYMRTDRKFRAGQPIILNFPLIQLDEIIEAHGKIVRVKNKGFAVNFLNPINELVCEADRTSQNQYPINH